MRGPTGGGEFERDYQVVGNFSEGTSLLCGILARGPAGVGVLELGGQQVVGNLSEGTSMLRGILERGPAGCEEFE